MSVWAGLFVTACPPRVKVIKLAERQSCRICKGLKRICLLRHAKAAPPESGQDDSDRPLLPRGAADAARLARFLAARGFKPDLALLSPAMRTRQTAELALSDLGVTMDVRDALYLAPMIRLLGILHAVPAQVHSVMIVGHNPGMEDLASLLSRTRPSAENWEEKFPTCALAVLDFDIAHWGDVREGGGALTAYARPGDF